MSLSTSSSPPTTPTRRNRRDSKPPPSNPFSPVSPPSAPRTRVNPSPQPLEVLTDAQLLRLTRSNTRKNLGTRRGRLRSQLERVCRKLDNIAVDIHLSRRAALTPVPVVNPDTPAVVPAQQASEPPAAEHPSPPSASDSTPPTTVPDLHLSLVSKQDVVEEEEDDEFAIEPATEESLFEDEVTRRSTAATAPILNGVDTDFSITSKAKTITGAERGSSKSVRISTSVTFLDYSRARKDQPLSISTSTRFDHPTRKDRSALMRRALEADAFPKAKLGNTSLGRMNHGIMGNGEDDETEGHRSVEKKNMGKTLGLKVAKHKDGGPKAVPFSSPSARGAYGPREGKKKVDAAAEGVRDGAAGKERRPSTMTTPTAAYAVSVPNGPYGARAAGEDQ